MAEEIHDVTELAEQLEDGFSALGVEYQNLLNQHKQLEGRLRWAKQQYLDLLKRFSPSTLSLDHLTFLHNLERVGDGQTTTKVNIIEHLLREDDSSARVVAIRQADIASTRLQTLQKASGVKIWSGPSADHLPSASDTQTIPMERDFTTPETPSKLNCPFASVSDKGSPLATPRSSASRLSLRGRRSKRPSFTDPIRAEICGNDAMSSSPSVAASGSAAVCPIRFLDQHDPEDVAKYFEKHKHELPRSHEVCITQFQSNQDSIKKLDRKYGNLVNMIHGLGQKHRAWLPEEPEEEAEEGDDSVALKETKTDAKIQTWATAVSASLQEGGQEDQFLSEQTMDEMRTTHFDRPFKEVRVGESPSRPWGISIPAKYINEDSSSLVGSAPTASPQVPLEAAHSIGATQEETKKCPFDHLLGKQLPAPHDLRPTPSPSPRMSATSNHVLPTEPETRPHIQETPTQEQEPPKLIPQVVFNGPVFLGYPPDQLVTLLQNSNLGASVR